MDYFEKTIKVSTIRYIRLFSFVLALTPVSSDQHIVSFSRALLDPFFYQTNYDIHLQTWASGVQRAECLSRYSRLVNDFLNVRHIWPTGGSK